MSAKGSKPMVGSIAAAQKEPCDGSGIASESLPTLPAVGSWSLGTLPASAKLVAGIYVLPYQVQYPGNKFIRSFLPSCFWFLDVF